jgi:hypothetical protein
MTRKEIVIAFACLALAAGCDDEDDGSTPVDGSPDGADGAGDGASDGGDGAGDGAGDGGDGDGSDDVDAGTNCTTQMFGKYGEAGFMAVNTNILANIGTVSAQNPSPIGDSFKGLTADDVARVEANLYDFLVLVYGGPNNYEGKSMIEAHTGLGITEDQYTAFLTQVVVPALTEANVPQDDITQCFAPPVTDPAFIATIVGL